MPIIPLVDTTLGDLPLVLDPSARDFGRIRDSAISLIRSIAPEWTDLTPNDPGVALLESVAAIAAVLHYAVDRVQNEGYLLTAQQRSSVIHLLGLIDYRMSSPVAASVPLTVVTTGAVTLDRDTFFVRTRGSGTTPRYRFELLESVTIPGAGTWDSDDLPGLIAVEGETVLETAGPATTAPRQRFVMSRGPMMRNPDGSSSVQVVVLSELWEEVASFIDTSPTDKVYRLEVDATGRPVIVFGDGVSGAIPGTGAEVQVRYRIGNGARGNQIGTNVLTEIPVLTNLVSVTNTVQPSGGSDGETISEAKRDGPLSLRALDRAVTLQDYEILAKQVVGVSAARAAHEADRFGVTVYLAAEGENPVPTGRWFPRLGSGSGLLGSVGRYLSARMVSPRLDVKPCRVVRPFVHVRIQAQPNILRRDVKATVERNLIDYYVQVREKFGELMPTSDVVGVIENSRGVHYVDLLRHHRIPALRFVRGVYAAWSSATLSLSSYQTSMRAETYEVVWTSGTTYTLRTEGGTPVVDALGMTQVFTAGVPALVNRWRSDADETVPVRSPQFTIQVNAPTSPNSGDVWLFGVDDYVGNLNLMPDEIVVPAMAGTNFDPATYLIEVVGGIG